MTYKAVALYGEVAAELFQGQADAQGAAYYDNALRLRDMGRLLLATEVRHCIDATSTSIRYGSEGDNISDKEITTLPANFSEILLLNNIYHAIFLQLSFHSFTFSYVGTICKDVLARTGARDCRSVKNISR